MSRTIYRNTRPDTLTSACLLVAAALPWYAVVSGVYGFYFYVILLVSQVGRLLGETFEEVATDALFALTLFAALPLGLLLLLVVPAGLVWAAFRHPPGGLAGGTVRAGCVASMALSVLYAAILIVSYVAGLTQDDAAEVWWSGLFHAAVLLCGLVATWRAWRWLRRQKRPTKSGRQAKADVRLYRNIDTQPESNHPQAPRADCQPKQKPSCTSESSNWYG